MMLLEALCVTTGFASIAAAGSVYQRSVHMVYALNGGLGIPSISDQQYLDAFDEADVTALVPFFLNVANPSAYESMIHSVQARNITIIPGIGRAPSAGDMDSQVYLDMAAAVKPYTDYVRIENMQGFYDTYGKAGTQNFINYCRTLGFKHIMMNPWPTTSNGSLVSFNCPECDSAFNSVIVKRSSQYVLEPSPLNWHVDIGPIDQVRALIPHIPILINYESPGPQTILTNEENQQKGSSLDAFKITIGDITGQYDSYNLHWAPPLTQSYNSIGLGTWDWIANELKAITA
ncbi:hypothetical protein Trihar35433_7831 [Trichoderma harzianum]|nr:hypothetical protein Trihar35433_7831 [Trichoderma harzianum]